MDSRRAQEINSGIRIFRLFGLWCPSCARSCERRIESLAGVISAKVEFGSGQLHLIYDLDRTDLGSVQMKIRDLGFSSLDFDGRSPEGSASAVLDSYRISVGLGVFFMMWTMIIHIWLYASPPPANVARALHILSSLSTGLVLLGGGMPFFKAAYHTLKSRLLSLDQVIVIGSTALYLYSWQNIWKGASEVYFDSIAMTIVLLLLIRWLDFHVREKIGSHSPYWEFLGRASSVRAVDGDSTIIVDASRLSAGKIFQIDEGEVPLDGRIRKGHLLLDESLVSGESSPMRKSVGEDLLAGSRILSGSAQVEVTRPIGDRYLDRLLLKNEAALSGSDTYGALLEKIYRYWIPGLFILSFVTLIFKLFYDPSHALKYLALTFLIGCPCIFIIPTTIMRALLLQRSQARGLHLRNIDFFERVKKIKTFVFDKTGTLTIPHSLSEREPENDLAADVIELMHFGLKLIRHPLCSLSEADNGPERFVVQSIATVPGAGTELRIEGYGVLRIGKAEFVGALPDTEQSLHFSLNGEYLQSFAFLESIREGMPDMLRLLKAKGYRLILASGDKAVSDHTRSLVGLFDDVRLNCSPLEKAAIVKAFKGKGGVCFVGDGLNDLDAFSEADLSISVMSGVRITPVSASVALPAKELRYLAIWIDHYSSLAVLERKILFFGLSYNIFLLAMNLHSGLHPLLVLISFATIAVSTGLLSFAFSRSVKKL